MSSSALTTRKNATRAGWTGSLEWLIRGQLHVWVDDTMRVESTTSESKKPPGKTESDRKTQDGQDNGKGKHVLVRTKTASPRTCSYRTCGPGGWWHQLVARGACGQPSARRSQLVAATSLRSLVQLRAVPRERRRPKERCRRERRPPDRSLGRGSCRARRLPGCPAPAESGRGSGHRRRTAGAR